MIEHTLSRHDLEGDDLGEFLRRCSWCKVQRRLFASLACLLFGGEAVEKKWIVILGRCLHAQDTSCGDGHNFENFLVSCSPRKYGSASFLTGGGSYVGRHIIYETFLAPLCHLTGQYVIDSGPPTWCSTLDWKNCSFGVHLPFLSPSRLLPCNCTIIQTSFRTLVLRRVVSMLLMGEPSGTAPSKFLEQCKKR